MKYNDLEDLYKETNKLPLSASKELDLNNYNMQNSDTTETLKDEKEVVEKYTIIDILKNPELRVDTLILWYAWYVYFYVLQH